MMCKWFGGLIDRLFVVIGVLLFAQLPMFMLQYTQQISGRAAELGLQINSIQRIAALNDKTLPEYIQKFVSNSDPDFMRQGELLQKLVDRFQYLSQAETGMTTATSLSKPLIFLRYFDPEIAKTTYSHFNFGIPFSLEGLIYALGGIGFGYLLYYFFSRSLGLIYQTLRKLGGSSPVNS